MATKNLLAKIILLLGLVTAGVQSAWADEYLYRLIKDNVEYGDLTFDVYNCELVGDGYSFKAPSYYLAVLKSIGGNADEVVVPAAVEYDDETYRVGAVDGQVTNNSVYKLTFESDINFYRQLPRVSETGETEFTLSGSLYLPNLHKIVFKGNVENMNYDTHRLNCVNLKEIYFMNNVLPTFTGTWSDYSTSVAGNITAYVVNKTVSELNTLRAKPMWKEFKDLLLYTPDPEGVDVNIYVTVEEASPGQGVMFQIDDDRYINGSGSKLFQTMIHSNLTFYVADGSKATPKQVFVNGRDVLPFMEVPETNPFYNGANPKEYTISNVSGDTYIRVIAEDLVDQYTVSAGQGGCVKFDFNGVQQTVEGGHSQSFSLAKGESKSLTIRPDEGFVFDRFWCDGIDMTEYMTFTKQIDGSLATTVEGGGQYLATFKPEPRQLFSRYGGDGNVVFTRKRGSVTMPYNIPANKPVSVPLPAWEDGDEIMLSIEVHADEKLRVTRDGMGVTGMFAISPATGDRTYTFEADDPENTELNFDEGINVWDEATWVITIEKTYRTINAYTNNDAMVEIKRPNGQDTFRDNSQHARIYEGETCVVTFIPKHGEELKSFEIGWSPIDIENESRLVKNDDGSYSFTVAYDDVPDIENVIDLVAVFERSSTAGRVFFVTTTGTDYVDVTRSNGDRVSFNNRVEMKMFDLSESENAFEVKPFTNLDEVEKVLLNGEDVTNDSRYFVETGSTTPGGSYVSYDFGSVQGNSIIQIVYKNRRYDVNNDGRVTISDVTKLVNRILGKE